MGSSASKTASSAAKTSIRTTPRKYPTRPPPPSSRTNARPAEPAAEDTVGPTVHPSPKAAAADTRDNKLDSQDPDLGLAARLSQLGPVQPNPTQSNSSTFNATDAPSQSSSQFQPSASTPSQSIFPNAKQNPAVSLLTARYRLAEEAEQEFANVGRKSSPGRQFLDVITIRQILVLRDEMGANAAEIERQMGLKEGVVARLGRRGVVSASEGGMMG
ncbi:hypothetical protein D0Z07_8599 [Hyphodiscus hymeniophilus]|uniref:Helix-turn-helix domain-containing protein n=1 Tax=Hyphodiscus hymeniophilus TaxID=353542 RepID=A0A9P6SK27_9HELO|nr:hypothetical protein D0Z07_8599 [Hyphodiscus hymeniophilus]